jgi:hypothetical protein
LLTDVLRDQDRLTVLKSNSICALRLSCAICASIQSASPPRNRVLDGADGRVVATGTVLEFLSGMWKIVTNSPSEIRITGPLHWSSDSVSMFASAYQGICVPSATAPARRSPWGAVPKAAGPRPGPGSAGHTAAVAFPCSRFPLGLLGAVHALVHNLPHVPQPWLVNSCPFLRVTVGLPPVGMPLSMMLSGFPMGVIDQ